MTEYDAFWGNADTLSVTSIQGMMQEVVGLER